MEHLLITRNPIPTRARYLATLQLRRKLLDINCMQWIYKKFTYVRPSLHNIKPAIFYESIEIRSFLLEWALYCLQT